MRRAFIRYDASGLDNVVIRAAPRSVWVTVVPSSVALGVRTAEWAPYMGIAVSSAFEEVVAVFGAAPSASPELRLQLGFLPMTAYKKQELEHNGEKVIAPQYVLQFRLVQLHYPLNSAAEQRAFVAFQDRCKNADWQFAVCVQPFVLRMVKPIVKELQRLLKLNPDPALPALSSEMDAIAHQLEDPVYLRVHLYQLNRSKLESLRLTKKLRTSEKAMGCSGPLSKDNLKLAGRVFFMGGMELEEHEPYTANTWLKKTCVLPPGVFEIERGGDDKGVGTGFRALAGGLGAGGPAQSPDGWWFESDQEALSFRELLANKGYVQLEADESNVFNCEEGDRNDTMQMLTALEASSSAWIGWGNRGGANIPAMCLRQPAIQHLPGDSDRGLPEITPWTLPEEDDEFDWFAEQPQPGLPTPTPGGFCSAPVPARLGRMAKNMPFCREPPRPATAVPPQLVAVDWKPAPVIAENQGRIVGDAAETSGTDWPPSGWAAGFGSDGHPARGGGGDWESSIAVHLSYYSPTTVGLPNKQSLMSWLHHMGLEGIQRNDVVNKGFFSQTTTKDMEDGSAAGSFDDDDFDGDDDAEMDMDLDM